MMTIGMLDLRAEFQELDAEVTAAVRGVLESGHFVLGPQLAALEAEAAAYVGARYAIGVASGTDALLLALRAAGIGRGDEVIVPDFTFIATATAVCHVGATPVLADVSAEFYTITAAAIEPLITARTRAVIVVHLFGQTAEMDAIAKLCDRHNLVLIEDAAQSIGADYRGKRAGVLGALGCFSFYPTKNLGAYGDAGMVTTNDGELAERVRLLRHHGSAGGYRHDLLGYNSRLDEIQAAVLRVKLRHLDGHNARRRSHAALYRSLLAGTAFECPSEHGSGVHVYHQFTVRHPKRDAIRERMQARGIATAVYYPLPLHDQPVLQGSAHRDCPVAARLAREVLSLPIYPQLQERQIREIAGALLAAHAEAADASPSA